MWTEHALALWVAGSVFLASGLAELISVIWKRKYARGILLIILAVAFFVSAQLIICFRGV